MKLWPARSKQVGADVEPVTDLDAIIAEPIPFKFKGKIHYLKPVALAEFLKFTNAQAKFMARRENEGPATALDLAKEYHDVISSVCGTISIDDILKMEQVQVAALYQLVIDQITGQVQTGETDEKKKRNRVQIYAPVPPLSSQRRAPGSGGPVKSH